MVKNLISVICASVLLLGCAAGATSSGGRDLNVITAQEIGEANLSNLYQVIQRLRPRWLEVRAQQSLNSRTEIVVYQGQTYLGGPEILRQLGSDAAIEVRYLDGPTASATLPGIGSRLVEAAIVVNPAGR